jgi:hypothetical protein
MLPLDLQLEGQMKSIAARRNIENNRLLGLHN